MNNFDNNWRQLVNEEINYLRRARRDKAKIDGSFPSGGGTNSLKMEFRAPMAPPLERFASDWDECLCQLVKRFSRAFGGQLPCRGALSQAKFEITFMERKGWESLVVVGFFVWIKLLTRICLLCIRNRLIFILKYVNINQSRPNWLHNECLFIKITK